MASWACCRSTLLVRGMSRAWAGWDRSWTSSKAAVRAPQPPPRRRDRRRASTNYSSVTEGVGAENSPWGLEGAGGPQKISVAPRWSMDLSAAEGRGRSKLAGDRSTLRTGRANGESFPWPRLQPAWQRGDTLLRARLPVGGLIGGTGPSATRSFAGRWDPAASCRVRV